VLVVVPAGPAAGADGLYVWHEAVRMTDGRSQDGLDDASEQERLLRFCGSPQVDVRRLYFLAEPSEWDPASLRAFLRAASERGIEVFAVPRGAVQDDWARPFPLTGRCDHGAVLQWVGAITALSAGGQGAGFRGLQLDLELHAARTPGLAPGLRRVWQHGKGGFLRSRRNARLGREFLVLLDRVRLRLPAEAGMKLAVTLPTWLDRDSSRESYRLEHAGKTQALAYHIMDRVDFVTLMNYVDGSTRSRREAWESIADEVLYGPTESLFETAPPGRRGSWPREGETLFEEGDAGYRALRASLARRFRSFGGFLGCAAHHYLRAYGSGLPGWPQHGRDEVSPDPPSRP
jgi:hypothetical protein